MPSPTTAFHPLLTAFETPLPKAGITFPRDISITCLKSYLKPDSPSMSHIRVSIYTTPLQAGIKIDICIMYAPLEKMSISLGLQDI